MRTTGVKKGLSIKGILLAVFTLIALFFSNDFGLVDVQKTAIVTVIGVDEEDGKFTVTAKVAIPTDKGQQRNYSAVSGEGKTVSEAVQKIGDKTGQVPKLFFCRTIVLGDGALSGDVFPALTYFLRSDYLSDDVLLCATEGKAKDVLSAKPKEGEQDVTEIFENIFSVSTAHSGNVTPVSLKDFAIDYYSPSAFSYMPVLKKDEDALRANDTALFTAGHRVKTTADEESLLFALSTGKVQETVYSVQGEDGEEAVLLYRIRVHKQLKTEDGKPQIKLTVSATARKSDEHAGEDAAGVGSVNDVGKELKNKIETAIRAGLEKSFEENREKGVDVFRVRDELEKYHPWTYRRYQSEERDPLQDAKVAIDVKIKDFK